jgi:hypothetical protein
LQREKWINSYRPPHLADCCTAVGDVFWTAATPRASLFNGADFILMLLFATRQKVTKKLFPFKGMARRPSLDNPYRLM